MDPRTHPRGAPPDFTLPRPNPNPGRMTDALWWLVCMRLRLEPDSANGGTFTDKPGFHNAGQNLPDHGEGNLKTDHSIRHAPNRSGPWWRTKTAGHDWTFRSAQAGDFRIITKYTSRLINAMKDPNDLRPDDTYWYTLGQADNDRVVEAYHENTNEIMTSNDLTHLWHRHDSFRRNIVGSFAHMWRALTIDMGWTYAEYLKSIAPPKPAAPAPIREDVMATADDVAKAVWAHLEEDPYDTATPKRRVRTGTYLRYVQGLHVALAAVQDRQDALDAKLDQILAVIQPAPVEPDPEPPYTGPVPA